MSTIISRQNAIKSGLKRYFTGKPCKRGHVAERQTNDWSCCKCNLLRHKAWVKNNPDTYKNAKERFNKNNPDKLKEYKAKYWLNNPHKRNLYRSTHLARKLNQTRS